MDICFFFISCFLCGEYSSNSIKLIVTMAHTFKLFQTTKNMYQIMGIYTTQSNQFFALNSKKIFFFCSLTLLFCSHFGYFLYETTLANGNPLCKSFYASLANLNSLIGFLISVWKMPNILKFIETCEQFIEHSKFYNKSGDTPFKYSRNYSADLSRS